MKNTVIYSELENATTDCLNNENHNNFNNINNFKNLVKMKKNQFFKKMTLTVAMIALSGAMFNLLAQTPVCEGDIYEIAVKITNATEVTAEWVEDFEGTGEVPELEFDEISEEWVWTYQTTSGDAGNTIKVKFITDYTGVYCDTGDVMTFTFDVNKRPDAPTLNAPGTIPICESETINATFLNGFVSGSNPIEYYTDEECETLLTGITAQLSPGTYTIYAISRNTTTNCTTYPDEALEITVTVNALPAAPTVKSNADQSICDGGTIDVDFLTALLDVAPGTTPEFYTDPTCGIMHLFTGSVTAILTNTPYVYYVIARNDATGCATAAEGKTTLSIEVNALPAAPTLTSSDDIYICEGETIDATFLASFVTSSNAIEYYTDESCAPSFLFTSTIATLSPNQVILYAISRNTATDCATDSEEALKVIVNVNALPAAPTLTSSDDIYICEGATIDATFLASFVTSSNDIEYYTHESCAPSYLFTSTTASLSQDPFILYAISRNSATGCTSDPEEALEVIVNVNALPAAPTLNKPGNVEICDGETIDASFLNTVVSAPGFTIKYYTNPECTTELDEIEAAENGSYTIYAIAKNEATQCMTATIDKLVINIDGINCDCIPAVIDVIYEGVKRN